MTGVKTNFCITGIAACERAYVCTKYFIQKFFLFIYHNKIKEVFHHKTFHMPLPCNRTIYDTKKKFFFKNRLIRTVLKKNKTEKYIYNPSDPSKFLNLFDVAINLWWDHNKFFADILMLFINVKNFSSCKLYKMIYVVSSFKNKQCKQKIPSRIIFRRRSF